MGSILEVLILDILILETVMANGYYTEGVNIGGFDTRYLNTRDCDGKWILYRRGQYWRF